ncbi:MAG: carbohydrate kinase [Xenococcus sp. MO_188.B8]|nr:carbohydrate kinase [Xenococcus sp. MO_188.B8]
MKSQGITLPNRVICLGEILFDCLADDSGQSLNQVKSWTAYPGGAPANTACALTKLGTSSAFIGCIGQDSLGESLIQILQTEGVNISGIQRNSKFPTRQVYVIRQANGDRDFTGFSSSQPSAFADAYLQAQNLREILFLEAEYLVIGTLELAYSQTRQAVFRALELAERYHLKIVLDVNRRPMFWDNEAEAKTLIAKLWQYVDFVKLTKEEAKWLFGKTDAGSISYHLGSVEGVLISDGDGEVNYCLSDNEGRVKPFSLQAIDTTGAGDAFTAGFIHQLCQHGISSLSNRDLAKNIVIYACAVGGLTVTKPGAISAQPTAKEVQLFLQQHHNAN